MKAKVIGLSGMIASGKSTVRVMFQEFGVPCLDLDHVARVIQSDPLHPTMGQLRDYYPDAFSNGVFQRDKMRSIIVADPSADITLKLLMATPVLAIAQDWTASFTDVPFVLWESALLGGVPDIDRFLRVECSTEVQLARLRQRNPDWTTEQQQGMLRMGNKLLMPADDVIVNDGSAQELAAKVEMLYHQYRTGWGNDESK